MPFVNLTPHAIDVYGDETLTVSIPPSGQVARVKEERKSTPPVEVGTMYIQTSRPTYGAVQDLPDPDGESIYLVSALVLAQCAGRTDVFAPGPAIRDAAGRIIGCAGLSAAPVEQPVEMPEGVRKLAVLAMWASVQVDWELAVRGGISDCEVAIHTPDGSDWALGVDEDLMGAIEKCAADMAAAKVEP